MIRRSTKAAYYLLLSYPMQVSGAVYRRVLAPRTGCVRVHLGPGPRNYIKGWINVDANIISAKVDVWADLKNPLPFHDASVDAFYSHHVIEHLPDGALPSLFGEMFRCLKPGGIIRVGGPDGDTAMRKYIEGDMAWFPDYPDERKSVGGRFANFVLCRGEHLTILTPSYLKELAETAGFENVSRAAPQRETFHPSLIGPEVLERESEPTPEAPHTLMIEARKPI